MTGFGSTETAPFAFSTGPEGAFAGLVGFPAPGLELKLAPVGAKLEARVRGPNITPGYWRDEELTRRRVRRGRAIYRLGDAMRFVDPDDPSKGLIFDGRLAEDFKLSTGTWVSVGPLRARILAAAGGPCAGRRHHRPRSRVCRRADLSEPGRLPRLSPGSPADAPAADVLAHPAVVSAFQRRARRARAREHRQLHVRRARAVLDQPPSLDAREITDKGSLNQKVVLAAPRGAGRRALRSGALHARAASLPHFAHDHIESTRSKLVAIDVHVHLEHPGGDTEADKQAAEVLQRRRRRATGARWPSTTARATWPSSSLRSTRR